MFGNTWIDYVIIGIFFINIGLGLMRGLMREIISILALIIAFVVAIKFAKPLADWIGTSPSTQDVVIVISKRLAGGTSAEIGGLVSAGLHLFTFGLSFLLLLAGSFSACEAVVQLAPFDVLAVSGMTITMFYRLLGGALGFIRGYAFSVVFLYALSLSPMIQNAAWTQSYYVPKLLPTVNQLSQALGTPT